MEGLPDADEPPHLHSLALVGVFPGPEIKARPLQAYAVPLNDQIHDAVLVTAKEQVQITLGIDPFAVDPDDPVARQQPLGTFIGKAFHKRVDDRDHKEGILGQEQRQQDKAGEEVHKGSRHQNDELSPGRLIGKCPGVVGGVVLPLHGAEAAHGDGAQGILRLPFLRGEQQRPHADGKFVHPHPQQLGGDEVSELMQGDEDTKHENGDDDIEHKRIQSP